LKCYWCDNMRLLILLVTFCAMELFSYAVHKYLFHGLLWNVHKSHHFPKHDGLELNDLFSGFFALVAAVLIITGAIDGDYKLWVGFGITVYGLVYFVFHDVIIHQRVPGKWKVRSGYVHRIARAHKLHHKDLSKRGTEAYGLMWVPKSLNLRNVKESHR
jgi:beta-carotene 3-hydroxylase